MNFGFTHERDVLPNHREVSNKEKSLLLLNLCLCAIVPALLVTAYLTGVIGTKPGSLADSDCYVHLLRAEELWQTGRWYDPVMERSNAPYGEELHWTRPFDLLLLLGGAPASLFVGLRPALFWWGVVLSPLLLGMTLAILPWVVRPLLGRDGAFLAAMVFVCQMGVLAAFQAGRPDHHSLLLFLFVLNLGFALRLLMYPFDASLCYGAGATAAASLWVSIESSLAIGLGFAAFTTLWVVKGSEFHRKAFHYSIALFLTLVIALLAERPPTNLTAMESDRLSIIHMTLSGMIVIAWSAVLIIDCHWHLFRNRIRRILIMLAGAGVSVGVMACLFPNCYRGPFANVASDVMQVYVQNVAEMQPLLRTESPLVMGVPLIGAGILCIFVLIHRIGKGPHPVAWLYIAGSLLVYLPLSLLQIRWIGYAQTLLTVPVTAVLLATWTKLDQWPHSPKKIFARAGIGALLCCFLLFSGAIAEVILGNQAREDRGSHTPLAPICKCLANTEPYAGQCLRILGDMFWGGEILYRTQHEVIGSPYHRNTQGILDTYRTFNAETDDEAHEVIGKRGIDLIFISPGSKATQNFYAGKSGTSTFYRRLCEGVIPPWCRAVPLPEDLSTFRLFEIVSKPDM